MPSHHNDSSAPPIPERSTTRKSSLRRLSSLANLQLNLFNRRRSNNATDTSSNAASITSSSSSTAHLYHNKSSPALEYSMSAFYEPPSIPLSSGISEDDESQPWLPMPEQQNLRIPKSRTFSNLPVPVRSSLRSSYLPKSQSSMLLPSSRIPTPSGNRRDSKSRLVPTSKSILKPRGNRGLPRSDTEPLLASASTEYRHKLPRITAFKENLSLSPIKPLPSLDLGERKLKFSPSPPTVTNRKVNIARHPQSLDAALASCEPTTSVTKRPELSVTQSSPIRKTATERRPNTPLGLPRYSSQPALPTATSGKRVSFGPDIRQQRLLSIKNPPTPPPKTPSNTTSLVHQSLKSVNNSGAIRKDHELIPCSEKGTPRPIPCENLDKVSHTNHLRTSNQPVPLLICPDYVCSGSPLLVWSLHGRRRSLSKRALCTSGCPRLYPSGDRSRQSTANTADTKASVPSLRDGRSTLQSAIVPRTSQDQQRPQRSW